MSQNQTRPAVRADEGVIVLPTPMTQSVTPDIFA